MGQFNDLDLADWLRLIDVVVLTACVVQMTLFLSHYWHWLIPLRRENPDVLAPPIGWTFAYHLVVIAILAAIVVGQVQILFRESETPSTAFTFAAPALAVAFVVVTHQFAKYYSSRLRQESLRRG